MAVSFPELGGTALAEGKRGRGKGVEVEAEGGGGDGGEVPILSRGGVEAVFYFEDGDLFLLSQGTATLCSF